MPTRNDYMYEAWHSMFQAAGAPPAPIPGLGAFNNPYAFSIAGAGASMGMPASLMQGQMGQQMQAFLPIALQLLTGDETLAQRLTSNNRTLFGNVSRAQQSQAILGALNENASAATSQNIAGVIDASGLGDVLSGFGLDSSGAADFLMQSAPFIDPRLPNMINRLDPAGGSLGLGTALYQATLAGTGNARINENTANILGEQFQRAFTQQQQFAGGDFRLLNQEATSGLTLPEMGILMQQTRARGITGDVLAGSSGMGLIDRLTRTANQELRPQIEDIATRVREGDLTAAEGLGRLQDEGLVSSTRIQEEREAAISENIERDRPQLERLSRSVTQAGSIFETLQDNIPALLEQIESMAGNLQNVNENEVRQALAKFQSLVEISGTSAEVLANQAKVIQSRLGVGFERAADLATGQNLVSARLQETGLDVASARAIASADSEFTTAQALQTRSVQQLAVARMHATDAGRERIDRALADGDATFLASPLQALIDAGQVVDPENARSSAHAIESGRLMSNQETSAALGGVDPRQVVLQELRSRTLARLGGSEALERERSRVQAAAAQAGIEGLDLSDDQLLEVAGLARRTEEGVSTGEAAAVMAARLGVSTLEGEDAVRFFSTVRSTTGRLLSDAESRAFGYGATFDLETEQRQEARREQERIQRQTDEQLLKPQFNRNLPGFLNLIRGKEDIGVGGILEAALVSGGVLIDEERFQQFSASQLSDEEADRIRTLKRQIQNAESPEEAERLRRQLTQFASEIGGELGLTTDAAMSAAERQTGNRVREQLGVDRLPTLSDQAVEASSSLSRLNRQVSSQREVVDSAKEEALAARRSGNREAIIAAERKLVGAQRALEGTTSQRDEAQQELRQAVQEDRRTEESREARSKDGERESRTDLTRADDESREGSGVPRSFRLENSRIILETNFGELVGELVDARMSSGDLADRTEQRGNR